jgi:3-phosphoshikimate 1-carboxyvinyltransferase
MCRFFLAIGGHEPNRAFQLSGCARARYDYSDPRPGQLSIKRAATVISTGVSPKIIRILPSGPLGGYVTAPPSKNYTARMLLAAGLASGRSLIRRPATNDDARAFVRCLRALGAKIEERGSDLEITGVAGHPCNPGVLNPDNAGAVLRLLLGVACLVEGEVRFETTHADSLGRRPNRELLAALRALGAEARGAGPEETLPITISGGRAKMKAGPVEIDGSRSSQFLSSLLFLVPHFDGRTEIRVAQKTPGAPVLVSRPLIEQTLEVLRAFGANIQSSVDGLAYTIDGPQTLAAGEHEVNGDWPSSIALMSAVAVTGGLGNFTGLAQDAQGERRACDALVKMGCNVNWTAPNQVYFHSHGELRAIEFDGDLATDAVLALEAAACLADGTTRIYNVANLKIKETDRIAAPLEELAKIGVRSRHGPDWIEITGRPDGYEGGIEVDCRGDHRIAQLLAIVGTRCSQGLTLLGADCVSKSYPDFFEDLSRLGVKAFTGNS